MAPVIISNLPSVTPLRWGCALLALCLAGCLGPARRSSEAVPEEWRDHHPWGPSANAARDQGQLALLRPSAEQEQWVVFGREHLQDGDLIFRMGRSYTIRGNLTSRILADISDSSFSHAAIVKVEGGRAYVYDTEAEGVRKMPFDIWMLDAAEGTLAVKRLKTEQRAAIPKILAYCEDIYRKEVAFDFTLSPGDDLLYCTEMIELAFRAGGIKLSEPIPIRNLPHYDRYLALAVLVEQVMAIKMDIPIYVPGNDHFGQYSSSNLETVHEGKSVVETAKGRTAPTNAPVVITIGEP